MIKKGIDLVDGMLGIGEGVVVDDVRLVRSNHPKGHLPRLHHSAFVLGTCTLHVNGTTAESARDADLQYEGEGEGEEPLRGTPCTLVPHKSLREASR